MCPRSSHNNNAVRTSVRLYCKHSADFLRTFRQVYGLLRLLHDEQTRAQFRPRHRTSILTIVIHATSILTVFRNRCGEGVTARDAGDVVALGGYATARRQDRASVRNNLFWRSSLRDSASAAGAAIRSVSQLLRESCYL